MQSATSEPFDRSINTAPERMQLIRRGGCSAPASLLEWYPARGALRMDPVLRAPVLLTSASCGASHGATAPGPTGLSFAPPVVLQCGTGKDQAPMTATGSCLCPLLPSHHLHTLVNLQGEDNNNLEETLSSLWPDKELR